MKKSIGLLLFLVVPISLGIWAFASRHSEPCYEGRSLTEWLESYDSPPGSMPAAVQIAVKAMGSNSVPHLLRLLRSHEKSWKERLRENLGKYGLLEVKHVSNNWSYKVADAFRALGSEGNPAIPEIEKMLHSPETALPAAQVLSSFGSNGVSVLLQGLSSSNAEVRLSSARALGWMKDKSEPVVPALIKCLLNKEEDAQLRAMLPSVLSGIPGNKELIVNALGKCVSDEDHQVRYSSITSLGLLGTEAKGAIPALNSATKDSRHSIRIAATNALQRISPSGTKGMQ